MTLKHLVFTTHFVNFVELLCVPKFLLCVPKIILSGRKPLCGAGLSAISLCVPKCTKTRCEINHLSLKMRFLDSLTLTRPKAHG